MILKLLAQKYRYGIVHVLESLHMGNLIGVLTLHCYPGGSQYNLLTGKVSSRDQAANAQADLGHCCPHISAKAPFCLIYPICAALDKVVVCFCCLISSQKHYVGLLITSATSNEYPQHMFLLR